MRATLNRLLAVVLVVAASALSATAQSVIEGVARSKDDGAPIPFALVRLLPGDAGVQAQPLAQGITSADGHYRFVGVSQGRYRVQLLRIGFQPVLSDPVQVTDGGATQLDLRVVSLPLTLPPVTVTPEACLTTKQLSSNPQLETLWQQARDGASLRAGFKARYRYDVLSRETGHEIRNGTPTPDYTLDQAYVSDPKSALKIAESRRSRRLSSGYYYPNDGWGVADELDVLHDDFLKAHCLVPIAERGDGEIGIRFNTLRVRKDFLDLRGTIWLDSATYLARRIEFEYVDGEDVRGTFRLDFGDVEVAGAPLRMPTGGVYDLRPSRKNPARHTQGIVTFRYSNFVEVPAR